MVQQVEDDFIDETPYYRSFKRLFMVVSDFMKQYTKPAVSFIKMAS
jgi:hypothetical protein